MDPASSRLLMRNRDGISIFSCSVPDAKLGIHTGPVDSQEESNWELEDGVCEVQTEITCTIADACWSPDGTRLAVIKENKLIIYQHETWLANNNERLTDEDWVVSEAEAPSHCADRAVRFLQWSPQGTFLVSYYNFEARNTASESEHNMFVYDVTKNNEICASFTIRRLASEQWPVLKWREDEQVCCYVSGKEIYMYRHIKNPYVGKIATEKRFLNIELSPDTICIPNTSDYETGTIAGFVPDNSDQKASIRIFNFTFPRNPKAEEPTTIQREIIVDQPVASADSSTIMWSPSGTGVLILANTIVDTAGKNYGGTGDLWFSTLNEGIIKKLNCKIAHEARWSPVRDEFIFIEGKSPADMYLCNITGAKMYAFPSAYRNTVRWCPFGSMVAIGGFGNLAGDVSFWYRDSVTSSMQLIADLRVSCTVKCEWSPCGRLLLMASTFPRMKVGNLFKIFTFEGNLLARISTDQLYDVRWKPDNYRLQASVPPPAPVPRPTAAKDVPYVPKTGPVPPVLAQFMRGEISESELPDDLKPKRSEEEKKRKERREKDLSKLTYKTTKKKIDSHLGDDWRSVVPDAPPSDGDQSIIDRPLLKSSHLPIERLEEKLISNEPDEKFNNSSTPSTKVDHTSGGVVTSNDNNNPRPIIDSHEAQTNELLQSLQSMNIGPLTGQNPPIGPSQNYGEHRGFDQSNLWGRTQTSESFRKTNWSAHSMRSDQNEGLNYSNDASKSNDEVVEDPTFSSILQQILPQHARAIVPPDTLDNSIDITSENYKSGELERSGNLGYNNDQRANKNQINEVQLFKVFREIVNQQQAGNQGKTDNHEEFVAAAVWAAAKKVAGQQSAERVQRPNRFTNDSNCGQGFRTTHNNNTNSNNPYQLMKCQSLNRLNQYDDEETNNPNTSSRRKLTDQDRHSSENLSFTVFEALKKAGKLPMNDPRFNEFNSEFAKQPPRENHNMRSIRRPSPPDNMYPDIDSYDKLGSYNGFTKAISKSRQDNNNPPQSQLSPLHLLQTLQYIRGSSDHSMGGSPLNASSQHLQQQNSSQYSFKQQMHQKQKRQLLNNNNSQGNLHPMSSSRSLNDLSSSKDLNNNFNFASPYPDSRNNLNNSFGFPRGNGARRNNFSGSDPLEVLGRQQGWSFHNLQDDPAQQRSRNSRSNTGYDKQQSVGVSVSNYDLGSSRTASIRPNSEPNNGQKKCWQYIDPKGVIQGPFRMSDMRAWNDLGYFEPTLPVRCNMEDNFVSIDKLYPPPMHPFSEQPRKSTQAAALQHSADNPDRPD